MTCSPHCSSTKFHVVAKYVHIMRWFAGFLIVMAALLDFDGLAFAQDTDAGRANFMASCAECHGVDGKGTGPRSAELSTKPADLTLLAKKNGGLFDAGRVFQIVDGRKTGTRVHLSKEMPIWGCRHESVPLVRRQMPKHQPYLPPRVTHKHDEDATIESLSDLSCDPEMTVQERILSIVGYLSHIQQ